eukprot:TRINITY_DN13918_c0_g1_i1.p1 TRINITY_DN13918_c0_g1~~TRINITY_DN13918_c0_g1_i1.p1  ORF type:complete len:166 (-),score=21.89 TRINITY_DN13918_c0_g1_i1:69-539(-)
MATPTSYPLLDWQLLTHLIATDRVTEMGRSEQGLKAYVARMEEIRSEYETVGDYVLASVFGLTCETTDGQKKRAIIPPGFESREKVFIKPNDFPYNLVPGIEHYIIWCHAPKSAEELATIAREFAGDRVYAQFVNPVATQSVRNVFHAHLFINTGT